MTDAQLPSDFDPALFFSDYIPSDCLLSAFEQEPPPESYSDDLEAVYAVAQERKDALNKQHVVIQHHARGQKPVFRSSSIPLSSPTPRNKALPVGSSFWETPPNSSPGGSSPPPRMAMDEHPLPSSPPPLESEPVMKKQRTAATTKLERGDVIVKETSKETPKVLMPLGGLRTPNEGSPRAPCKPFVPNFNLPLAGTLFGKTFSPKSARPLSRANKEPEHEKLPLPSPEAEPDAPSSSTPLHNSLPQSLPIPIPLSRTETRLKAHLRIVEKANSPRMVRIVTSSGKGMEVLQNPERIYNGEWNPSLQPETSEPCDKCFGLDMHAMMDNIERQKRKTQLKAATAKNTELASENAIKSKLQPAGKKTLLWTEKYRAKKFTDLIGEERTHRYVLHWLKGWDPVVFNTQAKKKPGPDEEEREHRKILILHGPPGLGKTTLAHVAARQAGYETFEINASDDRSGNIVKGKIKDILSTQGIKCGLASGKRQTVARKPVCLVIDEIDGVTGGGGGDGGNEAGFIKALTDLIIIDQKAANQPASSTGATRRKGKKKETFKLQRPIIAVCNDLYVPALKALRPLAEIVQLRKPPVNLMVDRLRWVFDKEGFSTEDGAIRKLVDFSSMGSVGGNKGDMRGALVSGEWIAARMKRETAVSTKKGRGRPLLTRKIVEEEFGGGMIGEGDGKASGGGRGSIKEAVEAVFCIEKERPGPRGANMPSGKKATAAKVQALVEGLGEFEKITMDCFGSYPTRHFNDDSLLSKPNAIYDWLYFSDLLSSRVFVEQAYELTPYLSHPILAFRYLFASSTARMHDASSATNDAVEDAPFAGPSAEWQVYEATKENTALLASIHSSLVSARLSQTFKAPDIIATELAPFLTRMLAPRINPVIIGGSGNSVASVRKESEKRLVARAVSAMEATGVMFEKIRVEPVPGAATSTGWAYRMEPAVDALGMYHTLTGTETTPVRYAVRQVLDQEYRKSILLKEKAAREARMGRLIGDAPLTVERLGATAGVLSKKAKKVKRDFFGRLVVEVAGDNTEREEGRGGDRKRRKVHEQKDDVWISFHEGFSNAVRKGIGLEELLAGLV